MKENTTHKELILVAQQAFSDFHTRCFWHMKKDFVIEISHLPLIVSGLRKYGGREGFILAAKLCQ